MAQIHGIDGDVTFANGHVVNVKSWTISVELDHAMTGNFADTWRGVVSGLKDWKGSYTCNIDDATAFEIDDMASQTGAATFVFQAGFSLDGTIIISGSSTGANVDEGPEEMTFNFEGKGALVVTGPA